ncbi:hypothetical protein DSM03_102258 [Leeuwenhoekiella aestuarii]|uniref:Uncharacterized protein n=1 Tax=Leeuwenhoekiella aestuarii TaxID=2249426 RepID=A0A4Q0NUW0_9FLAO|nr:hypothetical protein DSM04_103400 [Leeuwenhoekiella aestuarii]RXG17382.1 hypothetical protein DSM03_102258 [Leeuwenhoekiella aestuarii]
MYKNRLIGLIIFALGILILNVFYGDLMGFIGGILCGAGLIFAITGKISFLRT